MSQRSNVNPQVDKMIFKHTADKTKRINLTASVMRGGTRL